MKKNKKNKSMSSVVLLACQNCGHHFKKANIDWRKTKKIAKLRCPACKQPFRGEENALHDLSA
jgi:transcription elongation factor Elf1